MKKTKEKITISRIYKCCKCDCLLQYSQGIFEDFKKNCPLCHSKDELVIDSAQANIGICIDFNKVKTFGGQSDVNMKEIEKGNMVRKSKKFKKPWWRKEKIDFQVLKNPTKYINEGRI